MAVKILILLSLISASLAQVEDCSDSASIGKRTAISISNCDADDNRCVLHRDTEVSIQISFTLDEPVSSVKAVVHGVVLGVPVPFNLPHPDGCRDSGLTCPLAAGGPYAYNASLPVLSKYPKVTVDVKWQLKSDDKEILCVLIPAKIEKKRK